MSEPLQSRATSLRDRLAGATVALGIPSFNEGRGIVHTLESVAASVDALGLGTARLYLSDSSETEETVRAACECSARLPAIDLVVDRSERRRVQKAALNVIFERATEDLLVITNADVVLPAVGLRELLWALTESPRPMIAVGSAAPDPGAQRLRHRAARWQLNATRRYASALPADAPRAEGALWGAWADFYRGYRHPVGSGALHDDVELMRHAVENGIPMRNAWRALVYKLPAGSAEDFYLQTHRWQQVVGSRDRDKREYAAAAREALVDPVGALLYVGARIAAAIRARRAPATFTEAWATEPTTKR